MGFVTNCLAVRWNPPGDVLYMLLFRCVFVIILGSFSLTFMSAIVLYYDILSIGCLWLSMEMYTWRVYVRINNSFKLMD